MLRAKQKAFTLVELMVVIAIIAVLAGVIGVAVSGAFSRAGESETETLIKSLQSGVDRFETQFRFYPPTTIQDLSFYLGVQPPEYDPNDTNQGIEALVMALRSRREGGPFIKNELLVQYQSNTDSDEIGFNIAGVEGELKLFELHDYWENPLIYVNLKDLEDPGQQGLLLLIQKSDGSTEEIDLSMLKEKLLDQETGLMAAQGYVFWSFGEDGINDYGQGDDIASWKK